MMHEKAGFLFEPHRYKDMHGGRNGIKSWSMARALVSRGAKEPIRWLCCRETMKTIRDSVHTLLSDQIKLLGLQGYYTIQENRIIGHNGTRFVYAGIRSLIGDSTALKAYESFDGAWIEEAQTVSKKSLETLIPTIRKAGSEIWTSWNPELETDPIVAFVIKHPPPGMVSIRTTYRDNPWLSPEAIADMKHMKDTDPHAFDHVYEGNYVKQVEGAIFGAELDRMDQEGRVRMVTADPIRPVNTYWDIGDVCTSIWLVQRLPMEIRVVAYVGSDEGLALSRYVRMLQELPYVYGTHYLPHDAKAPQLSTGKSILEQLRGYGFNVELVPMVTVDDRINACKEIFHLLWFDAEKCEEGLQGVRHYRWPPVGAQGQQAGKPLHDWASHPGDALTYMAVALGEDRPEAKPTPAPEYTSESIWL